MKTLILMACLINPLPLLAEDLIEFEVLAGKYDREDSLISLPFETHQLASEQTWYVEDVASDKSALPQTSSDGKQLFFILPEPLKAGTSRRFRLSSVPKQLQQSQFTEVDLGSEAVEFKQSGKNVFTYNVATVEPPQGVDMVYRRSGFIHPVTTPNGKIVSDAFPVDHLHQHALFSAWTKCTFSGHPVDFWNQHKKQGTVEHRSLTPVEQGPVFSAVSAGMVSVDLTHPDTPVDVLEEDWTMRHFAIPGKHLFEIRSSQHCVAESPLLIEKYSYGGMAFRGSKEWLNKQGEFLTSEGKTRADGNHTRPNWVAIHGMVNGGPCGVAVFSHPTNFRSPQPVRLHPSMPYFVFSPPVLGEFEMKPGDKPITNRYLYFAFDGSPNPTELNRLWNDYAHPVEARWTLK